MRRYLGQPALSQNRGSTARRNRISQTTYRYLYSPLEQWLTYLQRHRMEAQWGDLARTGIKTFDEEYLLGGCGSAMCGLGTAAPGH
jgi:hypothetical protein